MLGVLLFFYFAGREAPEPLVPPPPPLPVLVAADGEPVVLGGFSERFWFGTSPLFDTGAVVDAPSIPPLTTEPEVLKELAAWAAATRPSHRLEFRFNHSWCPDVVGREHRAVGTVIIDEQKVRMEFRPADLPHDTTNPVRQSRNGHPDDGAIVTWNGTTLEFRFQSSSSPARIAAPIPYQTKSPFDHTPILYLRMLDPFQAFQSEERAKNFKVTFGPQNKPGTQVHLVMVGRSRKWHENFRTAEVILRAGTYEPVAMRWFGAIGHEEMLFVYDQVRRN